MSFPTAPPRATLPDPQRYDCRRCAACCGDQEGTVLVTEDDQQRWRGAGRHELSAQLTPGHFSLPALAMGPRGHCVHLGTRDSDCDCSIYSLRPESCRTLAVGDPQCLEARGRRGLPVAG